MKSRLLIISTLVLAFFSTCETDIDITGDYQRTPVVFGLLDVTADTQFVLINRTFLGSGDAFDAALVEDSMLYNDVDAKIWTGTGINDFVTLNQIRRCGKSLTGAFFAPCYEVFYVPSIELWPEWNSWQSSGVFEVNSYTGIDYKLDILADGEVIQATTRLSSARGQNGNGSITNPSANPNTDVTFVSLFSPSNSTYLANGLRATWNEGFFSAVKNCIKHEIVIRFNYTEVMTNGDRVDKSIQFPFTTAEEDSPNSGTGFSNSEPGNKFFQSVADRITPNSNVQYREIGKIDYILSVAGVDFTTFLNIGDPVSSVGQSRPTFSNINDGAGVGIFSSRDIFVLSKALYLTVDKDLEEMVNGLYTEGFCFCDPTGLSVDFGCDNSINHCQ
jgi:hypothetical protein